MYNGIGITTPRGTGTNGYVTRNLSFVNTKRERVEYVKDADLKKLETLIEKKGNAEILEHEKKRRIELKCVEMRDMMLNNGYDEEVTDQKVQKFRKTLIEREGLFDMAQVEYDEDGRPVAKETHQLAQASDEKNRKLREALGLGEFDPKEAVKRKVEEEKADQRRKIELANKRYTIVQDDDDQPPPPKASQEEKQSEDDEESSKEKKKKKKKDKEDRHRHHHRSHDEKKRKSSPNDSAERSNRKHSSKKHRDASSDEEEEESRHGRHRERSPRH